MTRKTNLVGVAILAIAVMASAVPTQAHATQAEPAGAKKQTQGRKFSKKPLLRMWFSLDERAAGQYMLDLMDEYGFESKFMAGQIQAQQRMAISKAELQGMMVFIAKGLIPSAVQMTFRTVEGEKEFKDAIFNVKKQMGSVAELSGSGDHYTLDMDFSGGIPIFGGEEGEDGEPQMMRFPGMDQIQDNPAAMANLKQTIHFRLIDNVMWQGNMPEIMDFTFPTYEQLQPRKNTQRYDVYGEVDLGEIPPFIKSVLLSTVNMTAQANLQQRDDEEQLSYDARRANGDLWLSLLQTVVNDIDKGRFSVQLARDDRPIQVRLDLQARSDSSMAKTGRLIGEVKTRFAAIVDRKAPMTVASSWGMPEQVQKVLAASMALGKRKWEAELQGNEAGLAAANRLGELLTETFEKGTADGVVQLSGDVLTGFAFVGGVQVEKPSECQAALDQLLSALGQSISHSEDGDGRKYLSINTGQLPIPGDQDEQFDSSTHLCVDGGCLWFSFGGPTAEALLEDTVIYASDNRRGEAARADTFRFKFDLGEWMKGDDETDGFSQYPRQTLLAAERQIDRGVDQLFGMLSGRGSEGLDNLPPRDSFIEKALKRGGDEVDLRLRVNRGGIDIDLNIGLGVANMLVARMVDFQGRILDAMMSNKSGNLAIPGRGAAPSASAIPDK